MINPKERRQFLRLIGGIGSAAVVGSACDTTEPNNELGDEVLIDFANDTGLLNFAYVIEQVEAAFYEQVLGSDEAGLRGEERDILDTLRRHEAVHRDALEVVLGANAISDLELDFSRIDFSDRAALLDAAQTFEDAGVAAYNGAGKYFDSPANLALAGKLVSVEARHAAVMREMVNSAPEAFANLDAEDMLEKGADPSMGFDVLYANPRSVMDVVGAYIVTPIQMLNV